jgi:hypothetical protein
MANKAAGEGRFADARDIWRQLWAVAPSFHAACNLGHLEHHLDNMVETVRWLSRCERLRRPVLNREEEERADVDRTTLAAARSRVGELSIDVPAGTLVTVDGQPVDLSEPVVVTPGSHVVRAELADGIGEATIDVGAGQTRRVHPVASPPAIAPSPPAPIVPAPQERPGPRLHVITAGAVTSGVLLVTGIGLFATAASSKRDRKAALDKAQPIGCFRVETAACHRAASAEGAWPVEQGWGKVAMVASGVTALATGVYVFWPRNVVVSATGRGLTVRGTW